MQRLHRVENNFVVERAAIQGMRMADQRSVSRGRGSGVEQRFETSGGPGDEE